MLAVLCRAVERCDPWSRGHGERVTALAEHVAVRLGWDEARLAALRLGGLLHDLGKLAVPPAILTKPGPLEAGELAEVRRHPAAGAGLLVRLHSAEGALPYVLFHHERWDGAGYPTGRAGTQIPFGARLLALADAFDAMRSTRPYREPLEEPHAFDELLRCAGSQFDPQLAALSLEVWSEPTEQPRLRASSASA
jgi:HD-GYP domain-containing protein (c-di-GMP phosphodiesterase class II)